MDAWMIPVTQKCSKMFYLKKRKKKKKALG